MKSDIELTADFKRGDRAAFHKLFRRHHMGLLNFFYRLAGDLSKAEDLAELVFLKVYADRGQIKVETPFKFSTYLYRVGHLVWLELPNRNQMPRRDSKSGDDEIMAVLRNLPEDLRTVLILCEMNGLTYRETASVTGLAEIEVRRRMNDAFGHLRSQLPAQAGLNAG